MNRSNFKLIFTLLLVLSYTSVVLAQNQTISNAIEIDDKDNMNTPQSIRSKHQTNATLKLNNYSYPKTGLSHTSNKSPNYKAVSSGDCVVKFKYEKPDTNFFTDIFGEKVRDTVVRFRNINLDGSLKPTQPTKPLYRTDDGCSFKLTLPFNFCFYGQPYNDSLFVNNNGNISFGKPYTDFSGANFPNTAFKMIAPFWADVDTRFGVSDVVYMRRTAHYAIFKWHKVGYKEFVGGVPDKFNSFMLVITDGTDKRVPNGLNVGFYYDDMQWTTGSSSGGVDGFNDPLNSKAVSATVGANKGNGVDYIQFGRFGKPGKDYDGPQNNIDGVDWLDGQTFIFSACAGGNNLPPIRTGLAYCDTLNACVGDTLVYNIGFMGPEVDDTVRIHVTPPTIPTGFSYSIDSLTKATPTIKITYIANANDTASFKIWAIDKVNNTSDTVRVLIKNREMEGSFSSFDGCEIFKNGTITYLPGSKGLAPYKLSIDKGKTYVDSVTAIGLVDSLYQVIATDKHGCSVRSDIKITQLKSVQAEVDSVIEECLGNSVKLVGAPDNLQNATYKWTKNNNTIATSTNYDIANLTHLDTGYYKLTIMKDACPGLSDSIRVLIPKNYAIANASADSLLGNTPFNITIRNKTIGNRATSYIFSFGDGTSDVTTTNLDSVNHKYEADQDTTFQFILHAVSTISTGCDTYDTLYIKVKAPSDVKPFNVISLDGDTTNAKFRINPAGIMNIKCIIYDRWGNKMHTFENLGGSQWNGEIWDGLNSIAGTYYYILTYNTKKNNILIDNSKTGFIQVIK